VDGVRETKTSLLKLQANHFQLKFSALDVISYVTVQSAKNVICSENYDQQCSALPKAVFTTLLSIAHVCGWVCYINCRKSCKAKLEKAQASQSAITEEMAKLSCTMKQV